MSLRFGKIHAIPLHIMKLIDDAQPSALLQGSTLYPCPMPQEDRKQATNRPSERLELLQHMISPVTSVVLSPPCILKKSSYLQDIRVIADFIHSNPDPKSDGVLKLILSLQKKWPTATPIEILYGEPWGFWKKPYIRQNTRLTNNVEDALTNLAQAGCVVSESEKTVLGHIITYISGWSASDPQHMGEPCFKFIQYIYRHLGHLYPILDDIWWPEVVENLPPGITPLFPLRILFNGQNYYVCLPETCLMYKAGSTLEEVFLGLKAHKDTALPEDDSWECVDVPEWPDESYNYFPEWATAKSSSRKWELAWEIEPFIPPDVR
jgi:hypothetical protein